VLVASLFIIALIAVIVLGYWFNWHWTGLVPETSEPKQHAKTLWDWLNLVGVLAIPVVVGFGVAWYTAQQGKVSERDNKDNQREAALQTYIDKMSELLLHEGLRTASKDADVRRIATLQTSTVLPRLDGKRKGSVLLFLYEAGLIEKSDPIVMFGAAGLHAADLRGCDLHEAAGASLYESFISYALLDGADFTGMHLRGVLFEGGSLRQARFIKTDLRDAEFFRCDLSAADLTEADLTNAMLVAVNLTGAIVTNEQLDKAKSLQDTIMPDGSKHT
jgi:hypothetical protein